MIDNKKVLNVPNLRFPEFNDCYKSLKLGNAFKLYRGSSPRPIINYITNNPDDPYWIKIGDMPNSGFIVDKIKEHISIEGAKKSRAVYKGDMILSNSMSFGKPYILNIDGFIHDGWFVIRDYQNTFDRDYLRYLLISPSVQKRYSQIAAGGVVLNISSDLVNSVIANIPSIKEQKKISKLFNLLDQRIETQNKIIEHYESLIKGISSKCYYIDCSVYLGDISFFMNKTNHLSGDGIDCGKYPFFTNECNTNKFFNSYDFDGEYIICNTGGKANFKYFNGKFACMSDCFVIKTNNFNTKKLYYYLQNEISFIDNQYFKGSGLKHLDIKLFKKMKILDCAEPDYQLINSIYKKIDIEKKYLFNLQNQKRYLLNNLFI